MTQMKGENVHEACPLSGDSGIEPLSGYEKDHLVKCGTSGFVFSGKIPSELELEKHYATYDRHLTISEITLDRYRDILNRLERYRCTGRIFDIGCGMGDFLAVAKEYGWEVHGCEFTQEAVNACRSKGIDINLGVPDKEWFEADQFDVVTSFEVIEHLSFPRPHVTFAKWLLRPGGAFYCTTPNFNSLERYLLKGEYNVIQYPEHLSYFTKTTLNNLLSSEGFEKIELQTTGISPARIKNSLRRSSSDNGANQQASSDEGLRDRLEGNALLHFLKNGVNYLLDLTAKGNALKAEYVKK